jgi:hypothetical protein
MMAILPGPKPLISDVRNGGSTPTYRFTRLVPGGVAEYGVVSENSTADTSASAEANRVNDVDLSGLLEDTTTTIAAAQTLSAPPGATRVRRARHRSQELILRFAGAAGP